MRQQIPLNIPMAIIIFAAVTAVALRAEGQPTVMTAGLPDIARRAMRKPPVIPGKPDRSVEQMQDVFHELHADGRHALCTVCDSQYRY
jgi:hypothetical protein